MSNVIYANDFAKKEPTLRVHCIAHPAMPGQKCDAFVFEYAGTYLLIDGGMPKCQSTLDYLLNIRRELLKDHPEYMEDPSCKLKLSWLASHFHVDHTGAFGELLLPCPYLAFEDLYLAPDSDIADAFNTPGYDGDEKMRPIFEKALSKVEDPIYRIHQIPFGKEHRFDVVTSTGLDREVTFTFLPPVMDFGKAWYMDYVDEIYTGNDNGKFRLAVGAVNNASVWLLCTFGSRRFLFTGDTMKRSDIMFSEGSEYMLDAYMEDIRGVDVMKYIHHGYARDHALDSMLSVGAEYLIVSKTDSPIPEMTRERYPDTKTKVVNVADHSLLFTCGFDMETGAELPLRAEWIS